MRSTCDSLLRAGADCVVADASVVISLSASRGFGRILRELPCRFTVPDAVHGELQAGRMKGHTAAADLETQPSAGRAEIVHPAETLSGESVRLVSSGAGRQIDLGEAEAIACALDLDAVALLDENRARRVCERHFPGLAVASTVDVFAHPRIAGMGQAELASLVRNAVRFGRMHVVRREEWVEELVALDTRAGGAGKR